MIKGLYSVDNYLHVTKLRQIQKVGQTLLENIDWKDDKNYFLNNDIINTEDDLLCSLFYVETKNNKLEKFITNVKGDAELITGIEEFQFNEKIVPNFYWLYAKLHEGTSNDNIINPRVQDRYKILINELDSLENMIDATIHFLGPSGIVKPHIDNDDMPEKQDMGRSNIIITLQD